MLVYRTAILITLCVYVNGYAIENVEPSDPTNPLGKGFFLSELDIYDRRVGGSSVLSEIPNSCIKHVEHNRETRDEMEHYKDTSSFYKKTATDTKISAKLTGKYTMGATLEVKTSSISSGSTDVQGTSLGMYTYTSRLVLDDDCYRKSTTRLEPDFIERVEQLPLKIVDPWHEDNWSDYENFFKAFGSHIVTQIGMGSSIRQWTFALKSESYTSQDLEVAACANFEGPTKIGTIDVQGCSSYTEEDWQKVSHYEIRSQIKVLGGSDEVRNAVTLERSNALLKELMDEGRANPQPIDYSYTPVWDLIKLKYSGTDTHSQAMRARAENLRQYYEGFKDYGCSYLEKNDIVLRGFRLSEHSSTYKPAYDCIISQEGCTHDNDCHIGGAGTVTYCYGGGCVVHEAPSRFGVKTWTAKMQESQDDNSYDEGVNKSCRYKTWSIKAVCDRSKFHPKTVWPA